MPQVIPLQAVASQIVNATLNNQVSQIAVRQCSTGIFINLYVNNALIIGGVIAENLNAIVRSAYLGFIGDLAFYDTQGTTDPVYTGLGSRYVLEYFLPSELSDGVQ